MTTTAIRDMLQRKPFEPFFVVLSSGDKFEVRHPENAVIMKQALFIAYSSSKKETVPDRFTTCSYLHIAALVPASHSRRKAS